MGGVTSKTCLHCGAPVAVDDGGRAVEHFPRHEPKFDAAGNPMYCSGGGR